MLLDTIAQDLRHALRAFRRTPGFTAVAVLTLSLGIGATTAIFSIVNAVLLRPLPYVDADRLVVARLSLPDYEDLRNSVDAFERTAVWASNLYNLRTGADTQQVLGGVVSPELPELLGATPVLGRSFVPDDDRADVVILGYGLWQSRFGGDPSIVGRTVDLSGSPYTVVGVAPSWFQFPSSEFQLWTGIGTLHRTARAQAENRGLRIFTALARLEEGTTLDQARAQVSAQSAALARAYPETNADVAIAVERLYDRLVGGSRDGLRVLLATVGLLLLIACANVANLMLARTASRERELAIRTALGAARGRIARQVLTESMVLALAGGALGLLVAAWGVDALPSLLAGRLPRAEGIALDTTVLLFALGASVLTALLFGVFPALQAAGSGAGALKEGGRGIAGSARGRRLRHTIAVAEVALAVTVVVGAALLVRSFLNLTARDPGFTAAGLLSFNVQFVTLPEAAARTAAAAQLLERVASVPGVTSVGASTGFPPVTAQRGTRFELEGRTLTADESGALFIAATPGYFDTIGAPVKAGREIAQTDTASAPPVVVVNATLASALFPGQDPTGKRLRLVNPEHSSEWRTIVGVVGDVSYSGLDSTPPAAIYTPFAQTPFRWLYVMVRQEGTAAPAIRAAVSAVHPSLTAANLRPMEEVVAGTVAEPRFQALLVASFAALALVLAGIGIYGVVAYSVAQRAHEIGIRLALGARSSQVMRLVLREGVLMAAAGVLVGLAGAALLTRLMASLLVGVAPRDPLAFAAAAAVLLMLAALASYVPGRRAVRVDPVTALRSE